VSGVRQCSAKRGRDANIIREAQGLVQVCGDRTPRVGSNRTRDTPQVRQRTPVDRRKDALNAPLLDRIIGR
jgi:hypothetical protein